MSIPYVDLDPAAIFIRMRVDTSRWHIVDAERELTWCGLFLSQGSDTRLLSETPPDRRCGICVDRFEEDIIRRPNATERELFSRNGLVEAKWGGKSGTGRAVDSSEVPHA